jgi:hypothetical protein
VRSDLPGRDLSGLLPPGPGADTFLSRSVTGLKQVTFPGILVLQSRKCRLQWVVPRRIAKRMHGLLRKAASLWITSTSASPLWNRELDLFHIPSRVLRSKLVYAGTLHV